MKSPPFLIPPKKFHRLPGRANLVIRATGRAKLPREGYRLTATSSGVEIEAADAAGEFYAQQTIRELAALGSPACRIEDWPDFSRRGVYLDCARGKVPTVATLKSLVEQLARWKINELQLYIKNAFTWRKHPELLRDLPKDIVMLHWEYSATSDRIKRTAEFAAAGVPVMVCPGTGAWQSHGSRLANAIGNVANFAAMGRKCGAVGLLNTDWGDYGNRNLLGVSWHGYAHGAAHSWNGAAVNDATFTQTFTFHTFSDGDGRLAAALRQLGSADDDMVLYHALVEPVRLPAARFIQRFQPPSIVSHYPELFPERISQVAAPVAPIRWPAIPRALAEFERTALSEYRLAARMNTLAALRAQLGQRFRAGRSLPTHQFRAWADEMRDVLDEFAGLWRRSNRPARLADNLKLMRWAAQEMDELCRRR